MPTPYHQTIPLTPEAMPSHARSCVRKAVPRMARSPKFKSMAEVVAQLVVSGIAQYLVIDSSGIQRNYLMKPRVAPPRAESMNQRLASKM